MSSVLKVSHYGNYASYIWEEGHISNFLAIILKNYRIPKTASPKNEWSEKVDILSNFKKNRIKGKQKECLFCDN